MSQPPQEPFPFDFEFPVSDPPPSPSPALSPPSQGRDTLSNRRLWLFLILVVLCEVGYSLYPILTAPNRRTAIGEDIPDAIRMAKVAYAYRQESDTRFLRTKALKEWQGIAERRGYPIDWRRLGILRGAFHQPNTLDAFRHITDPPKPTTNPEERIRQRREAEAKVPPATEMALWTALYGKEPFPSDQAATFRTTLSRLHLGWFESLAAAQLAARAKQPIAQKQAEQTAKASAERLMRYQSIQTFFMLTGFFGLLVLGLRRLNQWANPPAPTAPSALAKPPLTPLSARVLLSGFVTYLLSSLLLSLPLLPLKQSIQNLPLLTAGRLFTLLEMFYNLLALASVLGVMRWQAGRESPSGQRPSLRELFTALGLRFTRPVADVGAGVFGYSLTLPLLLLTSIVASWLFGSIPTPPNPVERLPLLLQSPFDRLLLLLMTAVMAPFVEELLFRGALYAALRERWRPPVAALASGLLFASVHPNLPGGLLPLAVLGGAFAWAYESRGSLLTPIVMHALQNGLVMLIQFAVVSS